MTQTSRLVRLAAAACLFSIGVIGCALPLGPPAVRRPVPTDTFAPAGVFAPTGPTQLGRVVRITDGDTIRVVVDGQEQRLRYIGIDTPERAGAGGLAEPLAAEATLANTKLVGGKEVALERDVSETDRYDRLLRYVWLSPDLDNATTDDDAWRLVNLELVRAGLAEAVRYRPDTKYDAILEAAESEARAARRGMWADD